MSPSASKRSRGFTLVEVMVAMMVMAILAVMAWQGVDGIVRTREASQGRLEQTLRLNTVIGQLEQDLAAVQESPAVPGITFDGATLRITRRAERGLQVVAWSLRPGPEANPGAGLLQRWAGPPSTRGNELQETWMRTQQFQGNEVGQLRTLTGVAQWQCYAFRGNAWSNCQSTGQGLPNGVRLVIEFGGPQITGSLTRDIAIGP
ncbi:prepilin-type N-terminal cleavage/methylation domain-containing protein [Piscinibacter sp. XHJ-5]|uniref:PulJ/GspJ family protein n=1 Tax=Piscinibacter sp. XHJ-5 TaxID=3037797 RepID=UPI0024533249|nr:prepilin-type N-terminal cleavage/methylation domain-containing protein [Piscinibacter sp. XHJ-5]